MTSLRGAAGTTRCFRDTDAVLNASLLFLSMILALDNLSGDAQVTGRAGLAHRMVLRGDVAGKLETSA